MPAIVVPAEFPTSIQRSQIASFFSFTPGENVQCYLPERIFLLREEVKVLVC